MLRIIQNSSAARAKSYYSTADYYSEGQELAGVWRGRGAELLGLEGAIEHDAWDALCDNRDPQSGERLTLRTKEPRTIGYDINWHAPKSVSLLYGLTRDERILDAFRESVDATMREMEQEAATRVRKQGQNEDRLTRNFVWGEFVHFTARPVDGTPDPHLHAHCFVFNQTNDSVEDVWKAVQFRGLKRDAPYFEGVFHARFAWKLAELGLPIARTREGWELGELSPELLKRFSRRTTEIEAKAADLGIDDPAAKAELGAKTRSRKAKELTLPELELQWRERMTPAELDVIAGLHERIGTAGADPDVGSARQAVAYAVAHEFQRSSVIPERRLLATALKQGVGAARPEEILDAYEATDMLRGERDGRRWATTTEVLAEERELTAFAREGRGTCPALVPDHSWHPDCPLNASQRTAVEHVLESHDRVIAVRGAAGVGKTTLMQAAFAAIEATGMRVVACAPTAAASRGVLRTDGFYEADTVARLLVDEKLQESARGQVLWIDEAGLLSTRTTRDLFRLADRLDARVLLTGDRFQHGSVDRGGILRLLEEEAGIRPAAVKEIQRQHGEYKEAVQALSEGSVAEGFARLDRLGWIEEIPADQRYQKMAADYVDSISAGRTALVVSPTHSEGARITAAIRQRLQELGRLGAEEREFGTLVAVPLTDAEKSDPINYRPGDVLQFFQHSPGVRSGTRLVVGADGPPIEHANRYQVFRGATLKLAPGDLLRITHNGKTLDEKHRLDNGATYRVKGFDERGNLQLANGWIVGREFGHLAHGYVVTSHSSQGKTVGHVLIGQGDESLAASSREQFYVSVSRGRHRATVYVDDKETVLDAVKRGDDRLTATEFAIQQRRERGRRMESTRVQPPQFERQVERELANGR